MLAGVIFDIDGTIIDSVPEHIRTWKAAFQKFGKDVSAAEIRPQIGKEADQLMTVFFSEEELKQFGQQLKTYRDNLFKEKYLPTLKAFPLVRDLFTQIKGDSTLISLASSSKKDELKIYKKIAQIEELVNSEVSADDVKRSKPHPDIFHAALERLGNLDPETVIVIGDTRYDAAAADKAKLRTIGLLCGGSTKVELLEAGCIALYLHPADLLARYHSSPLSKGVQRAKKSK